MGGYSALDDVEYRVKQLMDVDLTGSHAGLFY
jgi:hypothetical protein